MAVRRTATTQTPTMPRAGRKTGRAAKGDQDTKTPRKPAPGRQRAPKAKTTGKANPFDDIARATAAGDDDLARKLAASIGQGKGKAPTAPNDDGKATGKPDRSKTDRPMDNGKATTQFRGRPTGDIETIAERAKELGLRVRKDADLDYLATKLRATPDGVSQWLASRNGSTVKATPKAKTTTKATPAKAKPDDKPKQAKPPTIQLGHVWSDKKPDWLYRCTLVTRYEVHPDDGTVWSTLYQVLGPNGKVYEDFWKLPLDFRATQEVQGNGRKLVLKDRTINGLQTWLIKEGLTTPEDIG